MCDQIFENLSIHKSEIIRNIQIYGSNTFIYKANKIFVTGFEITRLPCTIINN